MFTGAARAAAARVPAFQLSDSSVKERPEVESRAPGEVHTRGRASLRTASLEELLDAAEEFGLNARTEELSNAMRSSVRLSPIVSTTATRTGAASFGGPAALPRGVGWPHWRGRPLTLLAQVDLGELATAGLPLSGRDKLLFFFDTSVVPSGLDPAHDGSGCVLHVAEAEPDQAETAADGPALPTRPYVGHASVELVIPRVWSAKVDALDLTADERVGWELLRQRLAGMQDTELTDAVTSSLHIVHRVFGYADHTGGDMPLICELCASGYRVPESPPLMHPKAAELEPQSGRWELLAQFSADHELGWSWGTSAERLYFWIDRNALAAGDFSNIWTITR